MGRVLLILIGACLLVLQGSEAGFSTSSQTKSEPSSHHKSGLPSQAKSRTHRFRPQLSELCLGCICEATSNCTIDIGCPREGLCGIFLISASYWTDAGMPVLKGDTPQRIGAYYDCVTDPYCASRTVRGYTDKYAQDCNRDGQVTCEDYARIHYMGGRQCSQAIEKYNFYKVFKDCLANVEHLNG